ncbi:phosphatase PAP2 family protein [Novosphingobium rosa]|uniref:phosphatase PAP2 family protein n=1 Tax=Novosphingobium rosa TaxID=76978 RepID=UPI000832A0BE|nr:phosphatase PAP2 family protein [Novosphingobium rosa]
MRARLLAAAAFAACCLAPCGSPLSAKTEADHLTYLDPALFAPGLNVPAPPPRGSAEEKRELDALHRLIAGATPERIARARADGKTENPSLYNDAVGVDLKSLPATWDLLTTVQREGEVLTDEGKTFFHRTRPYRVDPTLAVCGQKTDSSKPADRAYPSGHSMLAYSVGWTLARLMPKKADAILARAHDYALSRQYCGAHFASDTEASHVIGTLAAEQLFNDPRLASKIAAARAELSKL